MIDPNLIPVVGIVVGIPAFAFGVRAVLKPFIDAWVRTRELKAGAGTGAGAAVPHPDPAQAQRFQQLEAEVMALREEVARLAAVESFYAQLGSGTGRIREEGGS